MSEPLSADARACTGRCGAAGQSFVKWDCARLAVSGNEAAGGVVQPTKVSTPRATVRLTHQDVIRGIGKVQGLSQWRIEPIGNTLQWGLKKAVVASHAGN